VVFNKRFGRYTLVKKVAVGGMAEVYLALKRGPNAFQRSVALKCILEHVNDDKKHVDMFYREARLGGLFQHPNLIQVFDAEPIEGRHTMVMEFVPGQTVEELAERSQASGSPVDVYFALTIIAGAALGLSHAHHARDLDGDRLDLVHRDVSPANILVGHDGSVKVFDFGVAVAASRGESGGELAGKTSYMSPEQCRGKSVDGRSDIFSLGIVLHELLTGKRLFKRDNHIKAIRAITEDEIEAPSTIREGIDPVVDAIVMKALARNPDERYADAAEIHRDITTFLVSQDALLDADDVANQMRTLFPDEIAELVAVIEKVLMAPEQSESTIDLATFDLRTTRANAAVPATPTGGRVMHDQGKGLEDLLADADDEPRVSPIFQTQANAAVAQQLERARRTNIALGVVAVIFAIVAGVALFLSGNRSDTPDSAAVAESPQPMNVTVSIESTPPGAAIIVNGEQRTAVTPTDLVLPSGEQAEILLSLSGYADTTIEFTPAASSDPQRIRHEFVVDADSEFAPIGAVRINFQPENAQVFMGGELVGDASPVILENLPLNQEVTLRLEHDGFDTLHHSVRLRTADMLDIQLIMAEAIDLGTWTITSNPDGATVFIDDEEVGATPLENLQLPANRTYTIELQRQGYNRWRAQRQMRTGDDEVIEANLERPSTGRNRDPAQQAGTGDRGTDRATPDPPAQTEPAPDPEPEQRTYQLLD